MSINVIIEQLGWPSLEQVFNPKGAGPQVYAQMAKQKLGEPLSRLPGVSSVQIGILVPDPDSNSTQAPLAIVCEFSHSVSFETLKEAHALAWNFCRSPLLITVEPHLLRTWTCYEPPADPNVLDYDITAEIKEVRVDLDLYGSLSLQAAKALHWVELVSGQFFRDYARRFPQDQRADEMLLSNLRYIRQELHRLRLSYDVIHDLLARIIFIQFLFQRKDSAGKSALDDRMLKSLFQDGVFSTPHYDLNGILSNYQDAYRFFRWLNNRFNGDLFPGKGATEEEREAEWEAEMKQVKPRHLELLAEFVGGKVQMDKGQWCLWERYSFDAIPLEFISSIYEVFVNKGQVGVYYTPSHVVDFMLDGVLPWESTAWDIKVLDPACGSGIFLVKAFQRLVHRWKNANPGKEPSPQLLQRLLEENIFGVDIDAHAVRVASFSLYLALCDEIDPRWYWKRVRFPRLRDRQVVHQDFFYEDKPLFKLHKDTITYDLIVGNAPWGHNTLSKSRAASNWADANGWVTAYKDIGPLFLPRAASMSTSDGYIVMLQPAGGIILNQVPTAKKFRHRLFKKFKVEEIVNLSALRFNLFPTAISPACIITMRPGPPDGEPFSYICPKPLQTNEDNFRIVLEPYDMNWIYPDEAANDPLIWLALMWGGKRDLAFIRQLSRKTSVANLKAKGVAVTRQGIIRGDKKKKQKKILGRRILDADNFPEGTLLRLRDEALPYNEDPYVHSRDSTDFSAFEYPQVVLKQGWQQSLGRFRAAITDSDSYEGILCSKSYISIHLDEDFMPFLEAACLSYNSKVCVYYLLLTSGRFASYRPEPNVEDFLNVPIPEPSPGLLEGIGSFEDVDRRAFNAFSLKDSERILIEDLISYTLPDFKGDTSSPGRQRTNRAIKKGRKLVEEPELTSYCENFLDVLRAGFGKDKQVCATIYQDSPEMRSPVRLVAIHLNWPNRESIRVEQIDSRRLYQNLQELDKKFIRFSKSSNGHENKGVGAILYQRVARIYDTVHWRGLPIPTIYLVKPDQIRYWLRSTGLRDADDVASDIMLWQDMGSPPVAALEEQFA